MKPQTAIKLIISSILGIIVDQAFSITDIIKQAIDPISEGPFLTYTKPLIVMIFFLIEITAIYEIIDKIKLFDKMLK